MDVAPRTVVTPLCIILDNDTQLDVIYKVLLRRCAQLIYAGQEPETVATLRPILDVLMNYRNERDNVDRIK